MDLAKQQCSIRLQEGVGLLPSLQAPASVGTSIQGQTVIEGCALKQLKKPYRFNEQQKAYLQAKFNIGQSTGRKVDPDVVSKEIRRARGKDGERLFGVSEFLTPQQVSSFFSRLSGKLRQQQVEVTPQDILAAEEQSNFPWQERMCFLPFTYAILLLLTIMTYVLWLTTKLISRKRRLECYSISARVQNSTCLYRQ